MIGAVSGLPISGALVEINLSGIMVGSAITDNSGNYSISGIAPGSYVLEAYAANYQTGTAGVIMLAGQTKTANFSLEPNPGTISGTVTGAVSGLPIPGASIHVIYEDSIIDSTLTDSSGNYTVTGLIPGSYSVTASKVNYDTGVTGAIVSAGQTTTVDFALEPNPGTISGTVTGAVSGLPISGALIQVSLDDTVIFSILTDSSGDYLISGVSPDSYVVRASASNYQSESTGAIVLAGQTTTVDFALDPDPGTISGTVTGAVSGLPISGALIEVHLAGITVGSAITDNSGGYSITGMAPGSYIVHAYATNYQASSVGVIMLAGQTRTANFSLEPNPGAITGTVTGAVSELPISGASIQVIYEDTVIDSTLTDSFGDYTVTGLPPGSYTVTASKANYDTGVTGAIVSAGQTAAADFALEPNPGTISGTVIGAISSLPISGALIEVSLGSTIIFSTLTDSSGDYSISGVSPGSYVVQARAANYQSGAKGAIVLAGQTTTVDFALQPDPGTISGTVIGAVSGLPISGALVEVSVAGIPVGSGITDSSGNYSIPGMAPGSYIVEASSPNYQTDTIGVIMTAGQTKTANFALEPNPGTFSGKVIRTSTGMPISGASVRVSHDDVTIDSALTDSSGNYSISGIPPGSYTLDAYAVNYQSGTSTSTISANQTKTVNFSLQSSPGTISGTVTSALGSTPIAGALVEVNLNNTLIFSTLTDSAGNYSISGVAPNTYAVHAHANTYQTAINNNVVVTANMTTTVNFSLQSNPGAAEGTVTNSVTGLPLSGVFIDVFEGGVFIDVAVTDSSGNYSVTGLATDSYTLTANKTNYETRNMSFSVTAGDTTTLNFTLIPNFPPRNLTGSVIVNAFLLQADRIHHLQWDSALGGNIAYYRVYRNGTLLSNVSPNGSLQYDDHNRSTKTQDNYSVAAVNTSGSESSSASISLQ